MRVLRLPTFVNKKCEEEDVVTARREATPYRLEIFDCARKVTTKDTATPF